MQPLPLPAQVYRKYNKTHKLLGYNQYKESRDSYTKEKKSSYEREATPINFHHAIRGKEYITLKKKLVSMRDKSQGKKRNALSPAIMPTSCA